MYIKSKITMQSAQIDMGYNTYSDWLFNEFLINKEGSVYEIQTKGSSSVKMSEMEEKLKQQLGEPLHQSHSANDAFFKSYIYSDLVTFFCRFYKEKKSKEGSEKYAITVWSTDKGFARSIIDFVSKLFHEEKSDNIYVISTNQDSLSLNNLGALNYSFIRDNYEDRVLKGFDYIVSEYNKPNPSGRIAIMNGVPGGGKTNLLKGMISEIKNSTVILLPAKFVIELDSPSIVSLLREI
jgi:hypothetical protein